MHRMKPAQSPAECFTIDEFCSAHRIGRATYFQMKEDGIAPSEIHLGKRVLISKEAAARWRREREGNDGAGET